MTATIKISRELLEDLRDLASDEVERHRQAMGAYRGDRQARMDATIAKADALLATPPADAADMGGQAGELWAVHAQGPDDIYPAFDRADAERHAAELNAIQTPPGISVGAVVIPSPMSPLEHWKELNRLRRESFTAAMLGTQHPAAGDDEGEV